MVKSSSVQKMRTKRSPSVLGRLPNLILVREGHTGQPGGWESPAFAWRYRVLPAVSQKSAMPCPWIMSQEEGPSNLSRKPRGTY